MCLPLFDAFYDPDDESYLSLRDFQDDAMPMLEFLQQKIGMSVWMVTKADGTDWVVLKSRDARYGIADGQVFVWMDSFCSRMVENDGPRVAPDSNLIESYRHAPIGRQFPIRSYFGVPITFSDGSLFGTLCAIDPEPMPESIREELPMVELLANTMGKLLEKELVAQQERRKAVKQKLEAFNDSLTGLFNRRAWDEFVTEEIVVGQKYGLAHHVLAIDLDGLKTVNDRHGHEAGDRMICLAADAIREAVRDSDFVSRWGGDEFAVLLLDSPAETAMIIKTRIHMKLGEVGVSASVGVESTRGHASLNHVWAAADKKMYAEKRAQ